MGLPAQMPRADLVPRDRRTQGPGCRAWSVVTGSARSYGSCRRAGHTAASRFVLEMAMADHRYCLRGVVDLANAAEIRAELSRMIGSGDAHLLVDCTHLTFIDSTGIAVLLEANQKLEAAGRHMLGFNVQHG